MTDESQTIPSAGALTRLILRLKPVFPQPLWRTITRPYWWWYNRARHQLAGLVDPRLRQSRASLEALRNSRRGERCFVLGNGPSLADMDLGPLQHQATIGLNRIYLLFPSMGYQTSYLVAVNTLVIEQCADEFKALSLPKFITWRARQSLRGDQHTTFLDTDYTGEPTFSTEVAGRVYEGSTVTYVALQLAYHLGFEEVVLIGVDHRFQSTGTPNLTITSEGSDPNHFAPDYFPAGFRWQLPDLAASERAYRLARQAFEADGRRVVDATVDGALQVFPKANYDELVQ